MRVVKIRSLALAVFLEFSALLRVGVSASTLVDMISDLGSILNWCMKVACAFLSDTFSGGNGGNLSGCQSLGIQEFAANTAPGDFGKIGSVA